MGKLVDILRVAGTETFYFDYRGGSVINRGAGIIPAPSVVGSPVWQETERGFGVAGSNTVGGVGGLNYGLATPANFTTTGTVWCVYNAIRLPGVGTYQLALSKQDWNAGQNGYSIGMSSGVIRYSLADGVTNEDAFLATPGLSGVGLPMFLAMSWDAGNRISWCNGIMVDSRVPARLPTPTGQNLIVAAERAACNYPCLGGVLLAGGNSTKLSAAQLAQLYDEWLQEGWVKNLARKGFVYQYPAKRASEYTAEGIFFDCPEKRLSDGRWQDLTGNYPSNSIVGVPIPTNGGLHDECGIKFATTDETRHGNMTQLNGNTTLTWDGWVEFPTGNIPASSWWLYNNGGASGFFVLGNGGAPSTSTGLYLILGAGSANTLEAAFRAGAKQHVAMTYNNGVVKFYIDGEPKTTVITAALPVTFPNFSATTMRVGVVCNYASHMVRARTPLLTDAQVRAEYLKTGGQHLTLRETLEDVPVTLAASVAAPGQIGPWTLSGDSWACVESSTGRRSMKHIGAGHGAASRPSSQWYGTWHFFMRTGTVSVQECYVFFIASLPGPYNVAGGQNGFMIYLNASQAYLFRLTGGGSTPIGNSALGTIAVDTEYEVVVNRRPSDCRFTVWMRGGGWGNVWTQIIQVADPSHQSSQYIVLGSVLRQDSFPMYDPFDATV